MRITLIHGQNHKGSTYHIGRMLAEKFENAEIQEFFLPKDMNHFCSGCYKCIDRDEDCPFYDEKNQIMKSVENAELLIFTTPTYCMRASASMKAFIDLTFTYWMSHRPRKCMFSKKAVVISTAAGTGMKSAMKDITNTLFNWGVPYVKQYGISVQAMSWEQVAISRKCKIEKDMEKMANAIKKGKIRVGIKTKFMFNIMRMMQIKGLGSGDMEKEYWKNNGWLEKDRPWKHC